MLSQVVRSILSMTLAGASLLALGCGWQVPMPAGLQGDEQPPASKDESDKDDDDDKDAEEQEEEEEEEAAAAASPSWDDDPSDASTPTKRRPDEVDMFEAAPNGGGLDSDVDERRGRSEVDDELDERDPDDDELDDDDDELDDSLGYD